jgi:hypothetical protein
VSLYGTGKAFERGSARLGGFGVSSIGFGVGTVGAAVPVYRNADWKGEGGKPARVLRSAFIGMVLGGTTGLGAMLLASWAFHKVGARLLVADMTRMAASVSDGVPQHLQGLRDETLQMFDRTRSTIASGSGQGYRNYPDYAELAQARANVQFIREFS